MDKKVLQQTILEKSYQPENWLHVMKEYFGVNKIHQQPLRINLPRTDLADCAYELAKFETVDNRLIGLFEVRLTEKAWLERNRVSLRNLLRHIYKIDVDAALIVFVQGTKWRFSFVSEIRTLDGTKETEPKRYTYLFGEGETCRTAAERFEKLKGKPLYINDLFEAFSVEKLNKEFFKYYREHYGRFWTYLAEHPHYSELLRDKRFKLDTGKVKAEKPIRDFVKKLLGRIVFLQFLEKKGWMGVPATSRNWTGGDPKFLQNLFLRSKNRAKFHSNELRALFFETLNEKRINDLAPEVLGTGIKIPYLNGGLFDRDISYEHDIDFPENYFSTLLDFFDQYNFTIDENDPYDSEIGIDPEMLGHIFENLLEENREKGTFYTPKEIVHYMCQESLIQYLHTQLPDIPRPAFESLVRTNFVSQELSDFEVAREVNRTLRKVKICDPAIGSGAFPMGLLKEIYECRRLLYSYLRIQAPFDPALVKKEIIQQNIYGVDIEKGAVEIARLRFWLALVVDETVPQPLPNLDYKIMQGDSLLERFGDIDLQSLLDVEDEVKRANTQLSIGDDFRASVNVVSKANKEELFELIEKYFDPDEWEKNTGEKVDKNVVKREIDSFVERILLGNILKYQKALKKEIESIETEWKRAGFSDFSQLNTRSRDYKRYEKLKEQHSRVDETRALLIATQNSDERPYFLWHLWFKDVFDQGGFDIVIGNPPYIQLEKDGGALAKLYKNAGFEFLKENNKGDIYCLFYEKGNQILKPKGALCYITSNKWMRADYGKHLRKYFVEKTNPLLLLDFAGTKIFDNATVDVNILMFSRDKNRQKTLVCTAKDDAVKNLSDYVNQLGSLSAIINSEIWVTRSDSQQRIKEKVEKLGVPLSNWKINIYYGIKTGFNEAFIITENKRKELLTSCISSDEVKRTDELIRPLLRGRDIKRYGYDFANRWLIFIPWHFPYHLNSNIAGPSHEAENAFRDSYPAIYEHLLGHKSSLENRNKAETGVRYEWYALQRWGAKYWEEFSVPKIMYPNMTKFLPFYYDTNGFFQNDKSFMITGRHLPFLTAFLNSSLFKYCFWDSFPELQGGTRELRKVFMEKIPVLEVSDEINEKFLEKILEIQNLVSKNKEVKELLIEIDHMIFDLYSIPKNERNIIGFIEVN